MTRLRQDEDGALSPLFLMLMVVLAGGTFLFLQVGHASVLATDAETAADAAALAGAEELRLQLHNMANHNPVDVGEVCLAARSYAQRNGATLTDCEVSRAEFAVRVWIRGDTALMDGPLDEVEDERPVRRAKAGVHVEEGVAVNVRLMPWDEENEFSGPGGDGPVPAPSDGMILPVDGPITSPFGMRQHPITGEYKLHDGTDFGVACGTPIRAAASGRITAQYTSTGYGNRVIINHGTINGRQIVTSYNHLEGYALAPGATVRQGQVIGYVGSTGFSTGCHLHWTLSADGQVTDPMGWVG